MISKAQPTVLHQPTSYTSYKNIYQPFQHYHFRKHQLGSTHKGRVIADHSKHTVYHLLGTCDPGSPQGALEVTKKLGGQDGFPLVETKAWLSEPPASQTEEEPCRLERYSRSCVLCSINDPDDSVLVHLEELRSGIKLSR